jgi:lysozyme
MSKIGAHVTGSQRDGYGDFCVAKPSVVIGVNEGGALKEVWDKSNCHSISIFRDTTVYADAPQGIDQMTPQQAIGLADSIWPQLKNIFDQNPADYYTVLNEPFSDAVAEIPTYLAYESRLMVLAEQDNLKLCVLNLATGTPGDFQLWKDVCVPHIQKAFEGGHIYGRHAYSMTDDLVPLDGNTARPIQEALHLLDLNLHGGVVITELGFNGGYGYVGDVHFTEQVEAYEEHIRPISNIIGFCAWELGNTEFNANWQTAIRLLVSWMEENYTERWYPKYIPAGTIPAEPAIGVDVSHWQGDMDWQQCYAAGARFAYIKSTEGTTHVDDRFHINWEGVQDVAMYASPYHYYLCALDPSRQAHHFADNYPTNASLRPVLDIEDPDNIPLDISNRILTWLITVEERLGVRPIIYTSPGWWNSNVGAVPWASKYDLWVADWRGNQKPQVPNGFQSWHFWQYTNSGVGSDWGASSGRIDLNAFHGTVMELHDYSVAIEQPPGTHCINLPNHTRNFLIRPFAPRPEQWDAIIIATTDGVTNGEEIVIIGEEGWSVFSGMKTVKDAIEAGYPSSRLFILDGEEIEEGLTHDWFVQNCPYLLLNVTFLESETTTPPEPPQGTVDLLPYFVMDDINGPLYEVQTLGAGQERFQTQRMQGTSIFYFTKGGDGENFPANWEELSYDGTFIFRRYDTSQGEGLYYELTDDINSAWSKWCARHMSVGESFNRNPHVIHYRDDTCEEINSGQTASIITLVAMHDEYQFFTGITLVDVIELRASGGGLDERYWYAKGYGLVGFQDLDVKSAISEMHAPGARPDNVRREIACL